MYSMSGQEIEGIAITWQRVVVSMYMYGTCVLHVSITVYITRVLKDVRMTVPKKLEKEQH